MGATMVEFVKRDDNNRIVFRVVGSKDSVVHVTSYDNGTATIKDYTGISVITYLRVIAGLLAEDSNFESELKKAYQVDTSLTKIAVSINGTHFSIKRGESGQESYDSWKKIREATYRDIVKGRR